MRKLVGGVVFFVLICSYYSNRVIFADQNAKTSSIPVTLPTTASTLSEDGSGYSDSDNPDDPTNTSDKDSQSSSWKEKVGALCKEGQQLEKDITSNEVEIATFNQKEKNTAPILKSTYEILSRCFTILLDIQRFSKFLAVSPRETEKEKDKNDFVRCSVILKNFSSYFSSVSDGLSKNSYEIMAIKKKSQIKIKELAEKKKRHFEVIKLIKQTIPERHKGGEESMIENVIYHIATKSNSLEELDAELESENAVGVLKNTKVNTELVLQSPVSGKLVSEFGDKNKNGEMVCCIGFETRKGAIVTSPAKGLIVFAGKFLNYGNIIIISNGDYRVFLYGLSDDVYVTTGDIVDIGDYIGTMNDEVRGNNPVIEMELRKFGEPLDPRHWLMQTTKNPEAKVEPTTTKNKKTN